MTKGTVKFFNVSKGFGFIAPSDGSPDVFVHISAVEQSGMSSLLEGQSVTFELVRDARNGKNAAQNLASV
ncbi:MULTISPECIES: cold-shock protein [Rhizobium]|uniref:Cold shock protein (Beta-ribbon, CspA family) n=1 Tax=Rhizobium miluonense TaxID=411945 RepID=A0A1C3WR58_9HYPH|nr:cold-shock protein [Rhizobium miluonense]SCB42438.1 cold shock protein (beta-ribbon, CspA family) [Rhizobium miluonense]